MQGDTHSTKSTSDKEVVTESKDSDNSAARNRSHDSTQHSKVYQCLRFRINETVGSETDEGQVVRIIQYYSSR